MRKVPNTIWTRAENGQNRNPKNSFTLPLESTKNNLKTIFWAARAHAQPISNHRQFLHWNRSEIVSNSGLGIHFRKPRTATRFVPKVCKTQARKTLSSNSSKIRAQGMQNTSQKNSFTLPLESKKNSFGPQEHMPSLETHRQVLQNTLQNCREIWP